MWGLVRNWNRRTGQGFRDFITWSCYNEPNSSLFRPQQECVGYAKTACTATLACGHACGGIAGEEPDCLPCLHGCSPAVGKGGTEGGGGGGQGLRQDADDMCMVCFTDALAPIPSIQLQCGHVFHAHCCLKVKIHPTAREN